jgi:hypothetical protein
MAITLSTAAREAACDAIVDLVDDGEAEGTGALVIKDGSTVLVEIALSATAFGSSSSGVATASGLPLSGTAVADGDADSYDVVDSDGTVIWSGVASMSGGGGDLILNNTNIATDQTVTISSWTFTQPA